MGSDEISAKEIFVLGAVRTIAFGFYYADDHGWDCRGIERFSAGPGASREPALIAREIFKSSVVQKPCDVGALNCRIEFCGKRAKTVRVLMRADHRSFVGLDRARLITAGDVIGK